MSLQSTVDGILNLGAEIYRADKQADNQADLVRADEREKVTGEFQERFFEERQVQSEALVANSQMLLKYGVFAVLGFAGIMFAVKVIK